MKDLIERLEKATGPDRELDHAIVLEAPVTKSFLQGDRQGGFEVLHYTASIDAALTLVPEGWSWRLDQHLNSGAALYRECFPQIFSVADTPALALCVAALKARASITAGERPNG